MGSNPKSCDRCGRKLGQESVETYKGTQLVLVTCVPCDAEDLKQNFWFSRKLSNKLLEKVVLGDYNSDPVFVQQVLTDKIRTDVAIAEFEREVWYTGLQGYVQQATHRGHSMTTPNVEAILYKSDSSVFVTFRDPTKITDVTIFTDENWNGLGRMQLHSVHANVDEATTLINMFTAYVQGHGLSFKKNYQINII